MNFICVKCCGEYSERQGFCHLCSSFGTIITKTHRHADTLWREKVEVESAAELIKRNNQTISSRVYHHIKLARKALIAIYGEPGEGKTTMLLKMLDGFDDDVLYLSLEEMFSDSIVSKLKWLEIVKNNFHVAYIRSVNELEAIVTNNEYYAIGIDSLTVSTLCIDDLRRLANTHDMIIFFTLQVTKEGLPAGSMQNLHGADVIISIDDQRWSIQKSRFTGLLQGGVL